MGTALQLGSVVIEVIKKDIKNLHLSVHPPAGAVTIAAPHRMTMETIRLFAISKLSWIKARQRKLCAQDREPPRDYVERESHQVWGKRFLLAIVERNAAPIVDLRARRLVLTVRPSTTPARRQAIVEAWYRDQLREALPPILAHWEKALGVKVNAVFIQRMKTKWGSCNPARANIRLNSELAKKPLHSLEYVVAHELAHLIERQHNDRFIRLLDRHLPTWRAIRDELNSRPLAHQDWAKREG